MWNGAKWALIVEYFERLTADVTLEGTESSDLGVAVAVPTYPWSDRPSPLASSSINALALEWNDVPNDEIGSVE